MLHLMSMQAGALLPVLLLLYSSCTHFRRQEVLQRAAGCITTSMSSNLALHLPLISFGVMHRQLICPAVCLQVQVKEVWSGKQHFVRLAGHGKGVMSHM